MASSSAALPQLSMGGSHPPNGLGYHTPPTLNVPYSGVITTAGHPRLAPTIWDVILPSANLSQRLSREHFDPVLLALTNSLSPLTAKAYGSKWCALLNFLSAESYPTTLPIFPAYLVAFLSHLHRSGMAVTTIRTYISAISFTHKFLAPCHDPTTSQWVISLLKGFARSQNHVMAPRPPITKYILHRLVSALPSVTVDTYIRVLAKCLFLLAFHLAARGGELVVSSTNNHTLQYKDLSFIHKDNTASLIVTFLTYKHSKLPATFAISPQPGPDFCPVKAALSYLDLRGGAPGPLFLHRDGRPISLRTFQKILADASLAAGFPPFTTHSFRIGRTTELFHADHSATQIRDIGRWNSSAFRQYIRKGIITLPL